MRAAHGGGLGVGLLTLWSCLTAVGCGPTVEVTEALEFTDVTTGWFDAGILADGKNKVVPGISFKLVNILDQEIASVQLLGSFRLVDANGEEDPEELGSATIPAIGIGGLAPGSMTSAFVMQSGLGFTGTQPRLEMLQHRLFQDAKITMFAKHRSRQWVPIGEFPIDRQLLTQ